MAIREMPKRGQTNRIPPHNMDAEQSVLGAMLESRDAISNVVEIVKPDDFYKPAHTEIFEAITELYNRSENADAVTIAEELARRGSLEEIGGKPYIHGLLEAYPTASAAAKYARIVEEHARLRRLVSAGTEIQEIGFSLPDDVDQAVDRSEEIIYEVAQRRLKDTMLPIRELLTDNMEQIEKLYERGEAVTGISTGFPDLDDITSGFQPSNFIIVAARPGMGKCLEASSRIVDPHSGEVVSVERFVAERRRNVTGLGPDGALKVLEVTDWIDNGFKMCFRLTTKLGRSVVATSNHPFLTVDGWTPLAALRVGSRIAGPAGSSLGGASGRDRTLPKEAWAHFRKAAVQAGLSISELDTAIGQGGSCRDLDAPLPRDLAEAYSELLGDSDAKWMLNEDLTWDTVVNIEAVGERHVYDITVPDGHNFVAEDIVVHNSAILNDFALATALKEQKSVVIFNLEMSRHELTKRFLASEAKVDSQRIAKGMLQEQDWMRLSSALGRLADAPIFIDDSANITLMEIRAKCRRLKAKHDLGLVIIDYLQLMQSPRKSENRQQEVSEISRHLKLLARDLEVPVICAAQLNRAVEYRADKRPLLGDLRESGCLTPDTKIMRADNGQYVTLGELHSTGERDIPVWTLDEDMKVVRGTMTHVFSSGIKKVFRLRLRSGREIKASANHPFLSFDGWKALEDIELGEKLAVPRRIPHHRDVTEWADEQVIMLAHLIGDGCFVERQPLHYTNNDPENLEAVEKAAAFWGIKPRRVAQKSWWHVYLPSPYPVTHGRQNPINAWLKSMGLHGKRSREKFIPKEVFSLPNEQIALFLKHLWATDGHISIRKNGAVGCYYASGSRELIEGVRLLLLRLGVNSTLSVMRKEGYQDTYGLLIQGSEQQSVFLAFVGANGRKDAVALDALAHLSMRKPNTNLDTVPVQVWDQVRVRMLERGVTTRRFAEEMGIAYCGSTMYKHSVSRKRLARAANILGDDSLAKLAESDVYWDEVVDIEHLGEQEVFDATVPGTHNFIADGIVVHNSLEQDTDIVMFIYRDEVYNQDTESRGEAELIVAKHRNGPTGTVRLAFMNQFTKFASMARVPGGSGNYQDR